MICVKCGSNFVARNWRHVFCCHSCRLNGKRMNWSVNKIDNPTGRSLWGQLVVLGDQNNGLVGQSVTLSVCKDKQGARSYSVQEALKILQSREESSKVQEVVR